MIAERFDDARIVALMEAYRAAEYRWELDGHWQSLQIGVRADALEAAFPQARAFGLLSAWNPYSVERSERANREADAVLHAALRDTGLDFRPGFSSARNRSWREPSWVVMDMPLDAFDALARDFGQLGTLYAQRGEAMHLRLYRPQPANCPDLAGIDWVR